MEKISYTEDEVRGVLWELLAEPLVEDILAAMREVKEDALDAALAKEAEV